MTSIGRLKRRLIETIQTDIMSVESIQTITGKDWIYLTQGIKSETLQQFLEVIFHVKQFETVTQMSLGGVTNPFILLEICFLSYLGQSFDFNC